jgi:hypothetical protein
MKHLLLFTLVLTGFSLQAQDLFDGFDAFFKKHVDAQGAVNYTGIQANELNALVTGIAAYPLAEKPDAVEKAFMINAYNVLVINSIVREKQSESVINTPNFFTASTHTVAGEKLSLNELEKERLFTRFPDARLHFVLVCGAVSCPPIIAEAYRPATLEAQLDRQTRLALNDRKFVRYDAASNTIEWSALFEWYASDFGKNTAGIIAWVNGFRDAKLPTTAKTRAMEYDWSLNGQQQMNRKGDVHPPKAKNSIRYVVSSTIPKGGTETKIFNNLYTQATGDGTDLSTRSNFFTTFVTSLYGVSDRVNAGVELRYRRVSTAGFPSSPLTVFEDRAEHSARQSVATIGPKIRWAPVPKWGNFSIQSALWIPLEDNLEGTAELSYIDWNGLTSWTQIMNDFTIGQSFSVFTELSLLLEDIGPDRAAGDLNRFSTPLTVIASYFPEPKTTLYLLNGVSPYWAPNLDWFYQSGAGAKYQFNRNFEVELLYTWFTNAFLIENNGRASTFNVGIRFNT